ncbi:MAG: hypothetical protein IPQ18_11740 [Saprospiraceae bacterium]|nr:hypothetical protein [Saprospiraceae bacterium]
MGLFVVLVSVPAMNNPEPPDAPVTPAGATTVQVTGLVIGTPPIVNGPA